MARYRQTAEDRLHESEGMRRYWEEHEEPEYGRIAGESNMIHEDHTAPANLPQHAVMRDYPPCDYLKGAYYDDGRRGLDDLERENIERLERSMHKEDRY
jgi:hypothetical protein